MGIALATPKENRSSVPLRSPDAMAAARDRRWATTTARSPGWKGLASVKAVPRQPGSIRSLPAWSPVSEPVTVIDVIAEGGSVGKVICEYGEASGVPGKGSTSRLRGAARRIGPALTGTVLLDGVLT
jgi:hypothetical protein